MHYEYAVEPKALVSNWQNFRYTIEKFGYDRGRLISRVPEGWLRLVYDSVPRNFSDMKKKRLEVALQDAKVKKVANFSRQFDSNLETWIENAISSHRKRPFRAIIAHEYEGDDNSVLSVNDIDEQHPLMVVNQGQIISRDVDSLASAMTPMLRTCSNIIIVDPFFDALNTGYQNMIYKLLSIVRDLNPKNAICEIHYRGNNRNPPINNSYWVQDAQFIFDKIVPNGIGLNIYCWKEKENGEDFHARYLLTEKGGISVDAGFGPPVGENQTTDLHLMGYGHAQKRLRSFSREATDYELIRPILRVSENGEVRSD